MNVKVWITAFRLRTLPLAIACIGMGGFLAASSGAFRWDIFLLCVLTTVFLQILSNLSNDYGDSVHGADSEFRIGPQRAVQSGIIAPAQMRIAIGLFVLLCLASGITLLLRAFGFNWNALLFFFGLGVLSIVAAIAYTVGRKPYGYIGLGDLSVLVFFGLIGVMGSVYLFTRQVNWLQLLPALSCGFFSMGVLNVNNIRDMESDRQAGKFSIPVRIGRKNAVRYHWFLIAGGLAAAVLYNVVQFKTAWQFLFLVTAPLFVYNGILVSKRVSAELDPLLKQLAISTLLFVVWFGIGQLMT
ncbi:MAG: 1,4-dihydroxy-2-naphthoate polyprenyltransferase [Cyclobacteriaceae bacterium]|nr:1,4-dihydroxy-2-naphthoate polyprenyltransferase [Cyclobacteriaceae bacterium]